MVATATLVFLVVFPSSAAGAVGPIQKVLQLLSDLEVKVKEEGAAAAKNHEDFSAFCEQRSADLGYEIKTGKANVADLKAAIAHAAASAEEHTAEIDETTTSIATAEADLKAATEIRSKEQADFATEDRNTLEVIDALDRAIGFLEREARKGSAAMVQVQQASNVVQALRVMVEASMLRSQDAKTLTALVQSSQQDDGSPEAAVYESHSGSIIDTLNGLLSKAQTQLEDAQHKETAAAHNFEMLKQSLEDAIKYGGQDVADAKKNLAAAIEAKGVASGDLAVTSETLAANEKAKASLDHDCEVKDEEFAAEVKSRSEELAALAEARRVISEMTSGAKAVTYSSFVQVVLSGLKTSADLANYEVVHFVRNLAQQVHSDALAQLGRRIASVIEEDGASGQDPFAKVKGLISGLIERLQKEATADAEHKAYCDKELGETLEKKEKKEAALSKLEAQIDTMSARSTKLKEEVAELQGALAELAATQAKMDTLRQNTRAQYAHDKPEMEKGIQGVKMGLKVLREYYARTDTAHAVAGGDATGIVGLLEVIESDFTKTLAEMTATEMAAEVEYEKATKENEIERTTKEQDAKYKTQEIEQLAKSLAEANSDHESVHEELSAILQYNGQLIEMCSPKAETYEARTAKRTAEIAGLKEALSILEDQAVLLQSARRYKGLRGAARAA